MRKLSMKGKRRKSDNDASDGESEENGGLGSNAEAQGDAIECDTMPKAKRRSRAKNNGKNNDDRSETSLIDDNTNDGKINDEENGNAHAEKGGGKKKRKKEEPKATTSQDQVEDEDQEYEVEKIVAHRTIKGRRQFLVRWKGYNEDSDTWEQEKDLSCPKLIEEFLSEVEIKNEAETSTKVSKTPKGKRGKSKQNNNDKTKEETNGNDDDEDNTEYEVERIIDVYIKKNGKREFLIRWKGFKSSDDTWEPEDNLNCPDLIKKFMCKVEEAKSKAPRTLRTNPIQTKRYTLLTKDTGRRLSRRNMDKQRATYHHCDE